MTATLEVVVIEDGAPAIQTEGEQEFPEVAIQNERE